MGGLGGTVEVFRGLAHVAGHRRHRRRPVRPPGRGEGRGGAVTGWIFDGRTWFDDIVYVGGG